MNFLNKAFCAIAVLAALGIATTSQAGHHHNGPYGNPGQYYQMGPGGQPLTPEQMADAQQIYNETYADMEITRQKLAAKRAELNQVLSLPTADKGKIEALSREIGELRGQMLAARAEARTRLAQKGLPMDNFNRGPNGPSYGPCWGGNNQAYGPCWGNNGMMGWDSSNGWRHHRGGHGPHGPRGGCWR